MDLLKFQYMCRDDVVADVVGLSLKFSCTPDAIQISSQEYPDKIVARVQNIISYQARRYPHLFACTEVGGQSC